MEDLGKVYHREVVNFQMYTAKLLTAVRRGSVDVPTQYRNASDPPRRSKKHELRLTQYP